MRRRSSTRLGFAAALVAVAACIFSPLATPASYTIVAGGAPVTVTVTPAGTTSTATFNGTAGQRISLNFSSVTIPSARVSILKPNGAVLVTPFTVTRSGYWFDATRLPTGLPTAGAYKIVVDPKLTYTGRMVLTLYNVPADATGSIVAGGAPVTVTTTVPGQNAKLTFSGTAGQRVSVNLTGVSYASAKLRIYNPDGTLLTPTALSFNSAGGFLEPKLLPATGVYTLQVDPQLLYKGSATAQLYLVPADPTNPITPCSAQPCSATSASTSTPGQNAYLTFTTTTPNQRVSLLLANSTYGSLRASLLNPDGSAFYSPATTVTSLDTFVDTKTLPTVGQYKVFLDPQLADTGSVDVTVFSVPADATGTITPCSAQPCSATSASTSTPGQNAYLTFTTTTPNQRVSLLLANSTYGSLRASLLNPDGSAFYSPATTVTSLDTFVDTKTLPTVGQYKVFLDPQFADTGSVDVTVFTVPADATGAITPGTPLTISTTMPGQNALYSFSGTLNQRVSVELSNATYENATVSLLKPDGTPLFTPAVTVTSFGAFIEPKVLPVTGTYKVKVDPTAGATGSVDVKVNIVPADASATIASNATPVTISTTVPGQNAKLTFAGTLNQRVTLKMSAVSMASAQVTIYKPDGTRLGLTKTVDTSGGFIDTQTLPATGTYKIIVDPQGTATGSMTLTLYLVPADSTGTLTSGTGAVVTTTAPGQNASRTFGGTTTQRVSLKVSSFAMTGPASPSVRIKILKPDGTTLESFFFPVTGDDFLDVKALPANGTYKVVVDPQDTATGSLTLTYYVVPADVTGTLGASTAVNLTTPGQNAVYTFSGSSGQTVTITESAGATISLARVELKDPAGTTVDVGYWDASGGFFTDLLSSTGTYTVEVDPQGSASGSLTLAKS